MIVLLVNKYLHVTGGAETVLFKQWRLLEANGHQVIPFAMAHPDNVPTSYARFFAPAVDYERGGLAGAAREAVGILWSRAARRGLAELLAHLPTGGRPQVAHLHNVYHQLSPAVLAPLRAMGIPAVMTLHDYKLVCPNYRMYTQGAPCERCLSGHYWHAVTHRCVKDSYAKSLLCAVEGTVHRGMQAYGSLVLIISPSEFLRDKLVQAGWEPHRITVIRNPVALPAERHADEGYVVYCGRLVPEKGLVTLLRAARMWHGVRLLIAGDGPLRAGLEVQAAGAPGARVEFLGRLTPDAVAQLLRGARCLILPAEWPENSPLAVLEALAQGVPVVTTALGGLPELVTDGDNGRVVAPGDAEALAEAVAGLLQDAAYAGRLGRAGRERMRERHDPARWLERHLQLYAEAMG
jgi:glycosyltransferase involved in cell wall biosynthesis